MHTNKKRLLLREDKCLVLQPELVAIVGRSPALLLQQIHYWLSSKDSIGRMHDGQRWVYNTYEDWVSELKTVSRSTIHRSLTVLRKFGLIAVKQFRCQKGDRTNWYTINYDQISQLLRSSAMLDQEQNIYSKQKVKMTRPSSQNESIIIDAEINNKKNLENQNDSTQFIEEISENKQPHTIPLVQQMVNIWNQMIEPEVPVSLTQRRAKLLMAALKHKFQQRLDLWHNYCQKIASSEFLMGKIKKGFKATLDWALKFDSIQRVLERQFGIKEESMIMFDQTQTSDPTGLKDQIKSHLGMATYLSWFHTCSIHQNEHGVTIHVPTSFHREWIKGHFIQDLELLWKQNVHLHLSQP